MEAALRQAGDIELAPTAAGGAATFTGTPTGKAHCAELQVLMDSEVGGEVDMAMPLTGMRLARCYLP